MKYLTFVFIFYCFCVDSKAQQNTNIDTSLKFNRRYTTCEKKWVVLSRNDNKKTYSFGFIYIDSEAGFTYDLQGVFTVDDHGRYVRDTNIFKNSGSIKYRIAPNWQYVALLPEQHFEELKIKAEPEWVKTYYNYTDTVAHDYRWGYLYNELGESAIALNYLEPAYHMKPDAPGVGFELAFAYNALQRFDNAILVLESAIKHNSADAYFYKELGYAYLQKKEYDQAIEAYKKGLAHFPDKVDIDRGEMAFNMAQAYKALGNRDDYNNWMIKAKSFMPEESAYYKTIINAGF